MIKSGFSYLKLTAVVAVLAITLIPSVRPSTATNQPPLATAAAGPDLVNLVNEERALAKYADDLYAYHKQTAQLGKKASFTPVELDAVQRRSDDLKGRLSGLQNTIREIVKKLKAANEWDNLDITTAANITDPSQRAKFQQDSFKQLLEEAASSLSSHGNEVSIPVDNLRKKLTGRTLSPYGDGAALPIVLAAYRVPTPVKFTSLACTVNKVRNGIVHKLHGNFSNANCISTACACDPGAVIVCAPGSSCDSL